MYMTTHTYLHIYIHNYIHTYIHTYIPAHVHTYSQPAGQPASQLVSWPARQTHGQTYVRTTYTGVAMYIYPTFGKPRCTFWNVDDSRLDERISDWETMHLTCLG